MERLEFAVKGSKGDEYIVVFEANGSIVHAYCSCQAGQNGTYCKHRVGLLAGDVSNLVRGSQNEINSLIALLSGSQLEAAYKQYLAAYIRYNEAKNEFDKAKKNLQRAMYQ